MDIDGLTEAVTSILDAAFDWVSMTINKISEEPLLLLCVLIPFVSLGISLLKKLLTVKS